MFVDHNKTQEKEKFSRGQRERQSSLWSLITITTKKLRSEKRAEEQSDIYKGLSCCQPLPLSVSCFEKGLRSHEWSGKSEASEKGRSERDCG